MGRGVTSDSCIDKAAPAGSQGSQDQGRQMTREHGDGGQSVSHPRSVQEKAGRQTPHREGNPPSQATKTFPQPQHLREPRLS